MRDYTIYKDSKGKIFASFDDEKEDFSTAVGELKPIRHGKGTFQDMMNAKKIMIVREG